MCCLVFNNLLPQTPVCCHGNDSRTNMGLGLSGRRREIMNKQLCSIISNSMKKPQNHEFRWMHLSPCLNTTMRVLLLQNGIPTSHTAFGLSGSYLGMQFILLPFLFFPSSPSTDLSTGLDSPETDRCPTPAEAHHSQFLWNAEAGRCSLAVSTAFPSSGGHYWSKEHLLHVQTTLSRP